GVGGLLSIQDEPLGNYSFPLADGNGNITKLVAPVAGDIETTADYEYGPFGELIRMTGERAKANPFRFSTKYQDDESGLLYYGYRYYDAGTGKWLNREGGFDFVLNLLPRAQL